MASNSTRKTDIIFGINFSGVEKIASAAASFTGLNASVSGVVGSMTKALVGSNLLLTGISKLASGIKDAIQTGLDWQDWIGNSSAEIDKLGRSVNNLISPLEIAKAKQQLTTGGFHATTVELDSLNKAAVVYARTNKTEVGPSLDKLTLAIKSGSDQALRDLGLNITLVGTKTEKTAQAMRAIVANFKDMDIHAENANEKLAQTKNRLEDATGRLGSAIASSSLFNSALDTMSKVAEAAARQVRVLWGNLNDLTKSEVTERIDNLVTKFGVLDKLDIFGLSKDSLKQITDEIRQARDRLKELNREQRESVKLAADVWQKSSAGAGGISNQKETEQEKALRLKKEAAERAAAAAKEQAKRMADEGSTNFVDYEYEKARLEKLISLDSMRLKMDFAKRYKDVAKLPASAFKDSDEVIREAIERQQKRIDAFTQKVSNATDAGRFRSLGEQIVAINGVSKAAIALRRDWDKLTDSQKEQVKASERQVAAWKRGRNGLNQFTDALKEHEDSTFAWTDLVGGIATDAINGLGDALVTATMAATKGSKEFGKAMQGFLSSLLKAIAQMAMVKAIFEFAEAIAALARLSPVEAGLHFASGIAFTLVAAAAGVGAAVTAPKEASGASGGGSAPVYKSQSATAPSAPRDKEREKNIGVTVLLGNTTDPSANLHAQKQISAQVDQQQKDKAA